MIFFKSQFNFNYFTIAVYIYEPTNMTRKTMLRLPEIKFSFIALLIIVIKSM